VTLWIGIELLALTSGCGADDGTGDDAIAGSSGSSSGVTSQGDTSHGDTSSETTSTGVTSDDGDDGTTTVHAEETTTDEGAGTLVDGCWGRSDIGGIDSPEPSFESFACRELPAPCGFVDAVSPDFDSGGPAEIADLAAAQCVLESLRDGVVGQHRVSINGSGAYSVEITYVDLGTGVVDARIEEFDLSYELIDRYRDRRETEFYDACIADPDPANVILCLEQAIDVDACIDAEPVCPG
jgi:hypothetical protein